MREIVIKYYDATDHLIIKFKDDYTFYIDSCLYASVTGHYNTKGNCSGVGMNHPYIMTLNEWKNVKPLIPLELYEAMVEWIRYKDF